MQVRVLGEIVRIRFSHAPLKESDYPKFVKDNEQFINELYMKQQLKPPLADYYLGELKHQQSTQMAQHRESMQNAMLPPAEPLNTLPNPYHRPPAPAMYQPRPFPVRQQVPFYPPPIPQPQRQPQFPQVYGYPSVCQPMYTAPPPPPSSMGNYYPPPPPAPALVQAMSRAPTLPRAVSYYQDRSVFANPPPLGRPAVNSAPAPAAPPPKPRVLTFKEKLELSGIIKKDVKAESNGKDAAGMKDESNNQAVTSDPRIRDKKAQGANVTH